MNGSPIRILQRIGILAGAALAVAVFGVRAEGATTDVWMVRTYRVGATSTCPVKADQFDYFQLDARRAWTRSSRDAFFETEDPEQPTVVFAHGGFTDQSWATCLVLGLARTLRSHGGGRPVRVVVWKWPAERSSRRLRPALWVNMARADFEGLLLARWLRQFDPQTPPILVGYSAGCRIVGRGLSRVAEDPAPDETTDAASGFRAVLVAGAMDADALLPTRHSDGALDAVETMVVTRHRGDRALRFYPRLYPGPGPQAMGFVGPLAPRRRDAHGGRLELLDLTAWVAGRHDFLNYLGAPPLAARIADLVFAEHPVAPAVSSAR